VRFVREWGGLGTEPGEFHFPIGIAIGAGDEVFVTDFYNARVQRFSAEGELLSLFAVAPFPGGIAIDRGEIYVAHGGLPPSKYDKPRERDKVAVYDRSGELVREWGKFGTGDGKFDLPGGIVIAPEGRVYVADQCNRRVQVFDKQGKFLSKWGRLGFGAGEFGGDAHPRAFFAGPTFLALDRAGNVYTTEAPLARGRAEPLTRVQKFTADGKHLLTFGGGKPEPGQFGDYFTAQTAQVMRGPTGLCFDADGLLWVNSIGGRIQQFTADGKYLTGFGKEGTQPGEFYAPHGLAIDSKGSLYVVDAYNHRVQKFEPAR
jgi:DNA-binding beta-propeller fold protein YncE